MIKSLIVLLALLTSSSTIAEPVVVPTIAPATRVLYVTKGDIVLVACGNSTGTAFHIGNGKYVTASHVVDDCRLDTEVFDDTLDYAVIKGPPIAEKLEVSCDSFVPGQEYLAVGFGNGYTPAMEQPWIASRYIKDDNRSFIGEAIPGMSGGPVSDAEGKVHGVVVMRWPARALELADTLLCKDY